MRFLVFQHIAIEHPGSFRDFLAEDGLEWDAVELDEGEPIPDLSPYDALIVMGGPMDVWQEDEHPWLRAEKRAIREAVVERNLPYLGLCLGHQLLAVSLDGEAGRMETPEVGLLDVHLTEIGRDDPLFANLPDTCTGLQWHSVEVQKLPGNSVVLASSPACRGPIVQNRPSCVRNSVPRGNDGRYGPRVGLCACVSSGAGKYAWGRRARANGTRCERPSGGVYSQRPQALQQFHRRRENRSSVQ